MVNIVGRKNIDFFELLKRIAGRGSIRRLEILISEFTEQRVENERFS